MDYKSMLSDYVLYLGTEEVDSIIRSARGRSHENENEQVYRLCYSCIDLTSLNPTDTREQISELTRKTIDINETFPTINNIASICVYPNFVETVGVTIGDSDMKITSVSGGFPSSQTYLEVKMLETAMAVENGADEIDIVMNVGLMRSGQYEELANEIEMLKTEAGEGVTLKVIIESGALDDPEMIRTASLIAMLAGADFVKTSTGKIPVAATPEAAVAICGAIRDFYSNTGKKIGFKVAGGVRTAQDAALYYTIVEDILGTEWLNADLFRIGASSAANNLLSAIEGRHVAYY